ncbi:MAG: hypothetical protein LUQ65_10115 [Candidatus Helarchaeota archaeon]|nr:hypothetical protein [Candidatus Helarchaeota archaeon]
MVKNRNKLADLCLRFCNVIEKYVKYIVVSGFFTIVSGRSRATEDIDIIIEQFNSDQFLKMHDDLVKNGFSCLQTSIPSEIYDSYLTAFLPVRYIYSKNIIPNIELKFAKDELDHYQIATRKKIEFTELDVYFSSVEANIAFKEELLKSPKDLGDAKFLRIVYQKDINENEISNFKKMIRKYRLGPI